MKLFPSVRVGLLGLAVLLVALLTGACRPIVAPPALETGGSSAAESSRKNAVAFEAIDVTCPDGNIVLSASPLMAGSSELEVTQEAGDPYFSIDVTMHPAAYPGATWDRLRRVKATYDPENLFRLNQNISPGEERTAQSTP